MKSLIILGRQPALGLAELENLYGAKSVTVIGRGGCLLDAEPDEVEFPRLGGSIKLAKVLGVIDSTKWRDIEIHLTKSIPALLQTVPDGKLKLGLSQYGLRVSPGDINVTGLRLKKIIKSEGRSVRIIPNKTAELNSAQVLHNQLTSPTGLELVLARHGDKTVLAQTTAEQDIEAYARRDQGRPMRDAKVGMLPPKLAQVLVNLAVNRSDETRDKLSETRVLDPFCGTGVLLQEALLMGYSVYGTDLEARMIEYSQKNLDWLKQQSSAPSSQSLVTLEQGDATTHVWSPPINVVAGETYLGKPLTSLPPKHILEQIMRECDEIHYKFLQNIGSQLEPGARLCLAAPAWKTKTGFMHLQTLDRLTEMGYTRRSFVHARDTELIYHRPDQTVARELVILVKQ